MLFNKMFSGVMGENFDTGLTKEGIESLNIMQAAVPNVQQLFSDAEDALLANNIFDAVPEDVELNNVTLEVFSDESGRTNFDYKGSDGETIELRTSDGIFTENFTKMNGLLVSLLGLRNRTSES